MVGISVGTFVGIKVSAIVIVVGTLEETFVGMEEGHILATEGM